MEYRLAALSLVIAAGCGPSDPADPDFAAVRSHLETAYPDSEVEVIRWWPAKPLPAYNQAIAARKREAETRSSAPPPNVARLEFRVVDRSGREEVVDALFRFDAGGKVVERIGAQSEGAAAAVWELRGEQFPE
ncbi:hypothetical protein [Allosphingosinicella sp.]|uniref:hypothetical protein n=1 Tax=Allosphingosinicella sp. TaxID=2823234 RepID=UPI002F0D38F7